ncbi:Flp family type IVb pilin [Sphingopyxis flava]|uniref:Pilus assembly protein Flp/PilA n=1 Tax=Sphingopyxis flava TaxID=1507287 RepID=A0A1T5EVZ4_9SPHN|nr:Flp family type IVb pilin [Sphingopyxis flava]SKB87989.1 pilus assembly protein Flp/PilA [Sphingopyxis flava]
MKNFLKSFIADESGASAAEYALILAVVGAGIVAAAVFLGGEISSAMYGAGDAICGEGNSICRAGGNGGT